MGEGVGGERAGGGSDGNDGKFQTPAEKVREMARDSIFQQRREGNGGDLKLQQR
jgi:hypothetical protein